MSKNENIKELLKKAYEAYSKSDLESSKNYYLEVLKLDEKNSEALGNLGVIFKALGDNKKAYDFYIKAINTNPKNSMTYNNLGNLLKDTKNYKAALKVYADGIKVNPKNYHAYNNIGMVFENLNDNNKAIQAYKDAVRVNPNFDKAVNNIGVVLYKQKKYKEAIEIFKIALNINPNYVELFANIGACYNKLKMYDEAIENLDKSIDLNPKNAGAYTNLGNVYNKLKDYKKAAKLHEKSIELDPKGANAYSNVGTSYKYLGQASKAIDSYKKAIELNPTFENAHFDLATILLAKGDLKEGFKEYEWRFRKDEMKGHILNNKDIFSKPMFKGDEDVKGKTILLHSEQGFGDSIQFIRFLPQFKERFGCKIAVKCRDELKELFKCIDEIDILTHRSEPTPAFDYHLSIMSMPYILGISSNKELITNTPYLFATKDKDLEVKEEKGKINIGICWSASTTSESYEERVLELEKFLPIINSDKINVYNLQLGEDKKQIEELGLTNKVIDLSDKLTDFSKTASLVKELDLVISSDTSVVHLCGALDVPTWVLVPKVPDFRWQNKGVNSAWYKSVKIFRQKSLGVWDNVFQSVYDKLFSNFKIKIKK